MIRVISVIVLTTLLLFQTPVTVNQDMPKEDPCTEEQLRAKMAETRVASADARAESKALIADELRREVNRLGGTLAESEGKISNLSVELTGQVKVSDSLKGQLDALQKKIERANGRWNCKLLHLGCIGEK